MDIFVSYLSTVWGAVWFALYPICLVILAALFTYAVTVESGAMEKIRSGLAAVSDDRRVLALLIVWGLGTFMEGMAGFGTAVAIPAAILVGIGFDPMKAVLMCLVANTTPTAFGSVGVPILTLARETGCEESSLFVVTALLELAVTAAGPFLVLLVADGWRGFRIRGVLDFSLVGVLARLSGIWLRRGSASSPSPPSTRTTSSSGKDSSSRPWRPWRPGGMTSCEGSSCRKKNKEGRAAWHSGIPRRNRCSPSRRSIFLPVLSGLS